MMRVLRIMDTNGDHMLSREELKAGLLDMGIELAMSDFDNIMILLDRNHDGVVSFAEFIEQVRPSIPLRAQLVRKPTSLRVLWAKRILCSPPPRVIAAIEEGLTEDRCN